MPQMMIYTKLDWQVGKLSSMIIRDIYYFHLTFPLQSDSLFFLFVGALALELDIWTTPSADKHFMLEAGSRFEVNLDDI